ncbi:hypothetical protein QYM36_019121 [Artemia franciscana]|uniref:Uncharacterized protein n=1 Tax=Artemia franciscana TaxID=6661 RepID=A0AA88H2T0_ARTSF|nr:hypothetical protein QYM36_019121 [Artemia franciscana]
MDSEAICMSVVIGDDIDPRLSILSSQRLKAQIWHELQSCEIPKYKVLLGGYRVQRINIPWEEIKKLMREREESKENLEAEQIRSHLFEEDIENTRYELNGTRTTLSELFEAEEIKKIEDT